MSCSRHALGAAGDPFLDAWYQHLLLLTPRGDKGSDSVNAYFFSSISSPFWEEVQRWTRLCWSITFQHDGCALSQQSGLSSFLRIEGLLARNSTQFQDPLPNKFPGKKGKKEIMTRTSAFKMAAACFIAAVIDAAVSKDPTTARPVGGKITPPSSDNGDGAFSGQFGDRKPDGDGVDPDVRRAHEIAGVPLEGNLTHPLCLTRTPDPDEVEFVENDLRTFRTSKGGRRSRAADTKVMLVPIVWHVIHWGDEHKLTKKKIESQVDVLNTAYGGRTLTENLAAKTSFQFKTKVINYIDNADYVSDCRGRSASFRSKYGWRDATVINIFLCPANGYLGWAYLPWQYQQGSPYQAITIHPETLPGGNMYGLNQGDTLVHEMGHYLGLLHTFGSEGGCSEAEGDLVSDTPLESTPNYGCAPRDSCPNHEGLDPTDNFMDYTMDKCMFRFTEGQVTRMLDMTEKYRSKLFASAATYTDANGELVAPCSGMNDDTFCGGRGTMYMDGTACKCKDCNAGFFGDRCDQTSLVCAGETSESLCNSRGTPTVSGESCICDQCTSGYYGDFCQDKACDGRTRANYCNDRGDPFEIGSACMCLGCDEGYQGIWCERSACDGQTKDSLCQGRGTPTAIDSECLCLGCEDGYTGDYCERSPCDGASTSGFCNGRGFPVVSGNSCVCTACTSGYTGLQCEISPCNGKSGQSFCNGQGVPRIGEAACVCSACSQGYSGDHCENGPCAGKDAASFCNRLGTLAVSGSQCVCTNCTEGRSGDRCEINACTGKTVVSFCNMRGRPALNGNNCGCVGCKDGYSGNNCEKDPCESLENPCDGHGTPYLDGEQCKCRDCDSGYSGSFCEITPCNGKSVVTYCNNRGLPLVEDEQCVCKYCRLGYSGTQCEISPCTGKTSDSFCNGNAEPYVDGDTCRCAECAGDFVGVNCDHVLPGGSCKSGADCAGACRGGRCCSSTDTGSGCTSCAASTGDCNKCELGMYLFGWLNPSCRVRPTTATATTTTVASSTSTVKVPTQHDPGTGINIDVPTLAPPAARVQIRRAPESLYTDSTFDVAVSYTSHPKQTSLYVSLTRGKEWFGGMHTELPLGRSGTLLFSGISMQGKPLKGSDYRISAYTTAGELDNAGAQIVLASDDLDSVPVIGTLGGVDEGITLGDVTTVPPSVNVGCQDSDPTWKDRDGDGCAAYVALEFCKPDGLFGIRWEAGQLFADYSATLGGPHAGTVCCGCGGGIAYDALSITLPPATAQAVSTKPPKGAVSLDAGCPGGMAEFQPEALGRGNSADTNMYVLETIRKVDTREECADYCLGHATGFECKSFQYNSDGAVCTLLDRPRAFDVRGTNLWSVHDRNFDCHLLHACPITPLDNFEPAVDASKAILNLETVMGKWPTTASVVADTEEQCAALCIVTGINCRGFWYEERSLDCRLFSAGTDTQSITKQCSILTEESGFQFRYGNKEVCSRSDAGCRMADSFEEAAGVCSVLGARLCTVKDMQNDATRGAGCGFDDLDIWTSDACLSEEVGAGRMLSKGSSENEYVSEPTCSFATGRLAGIRCCGDANPASAAISRGAKVRLRRPTCTTVLTTSTVTTATKSTTTMTSTTQHKCYGCIRNYSPVCGADGVEYHNPCFAQCAEMQSYVPGVCRPSSDKCPLCASKYDPVCADGISYYSECAATCKGQLEDILPFSRLISGVCSQEEINLVATLKARSSKTCDDLDIVPKTAGRHSKVCGLSTIEGKCLESKKAAATYSAAASMCLAIGARLCSGDELQSNVAKGTGCALDKKLVWTRDICGSGSNQHFVIPGSDVPTKNIRCEHDNVGDVAHVRCCADNYERVEEIVPVRGGSENLGGDDSVHEDAGAVNAADVADPALLQFPACAAAGLTPRSDRHPRVCGFSQIGGTCHGGEQTGYLVAKSLCAAVGARLCSVEEMMDNVTTGTGCNVEGEYIWTEDSCANSSVFIAPGSSEFARFKPLKCVDPTAEEFGASVRCCETGILKLSTEAAGKTSSAPKTLSVASETTLIAAASGLIYSGKTCSELKAKPRRNTKDICGVSKVPKCHVKRSYSFAKAQGICQSVGARLCTAKELARNVVVGTGCRASKPSYTWSSDPCEDPNQRTISAGLGKHTDSLPTRCVDKTYGNPKATLRCCADVDNTEREAAVPNPVDKCQCPRSDAPVCAGRQSFINTCYASCAGFTERDQVPSRPEGCTAEDLVGTLPAVDCTSQIAMHSFSQPDDGRVVNSGKVTLGSRMFLKTLDECATACLNAGDTMAGGCRAFEFNEAKGYCELKTRSSWAEGFNAKPIWQVFNRITFC